MISAKAISGISVVWGDPWRGLDRFGPRWWKTVMEDVVGSGTVLQAHGPCTDHVRRCQRHLPDGAAHCRNAVSIILWEGLYPVNRISQWCLSCSWYCNVLGEDFSSTSEGSSYLIFTRYETIRTRACIMDIAISVKEYVKSFILACTLLQLYKLDS